MKELAADHSDEQAYRIAYLIAGFIRKTLTEQEHNELDAWVEASDENMRLFEDLTDENNIEANLLRMDQIQTERQLEKTKSQLSFTDPQKVKRSFAIWPYIAAACVLLAVAADIIFVKKEKDLPEKSAPSPVAQDVAPGGNRAILKLADGTLVDLEKRNNGVIKNETGTDIEKKGDGQLVYTSGNGINETAYNVLSTPRGGQYALTLSDGTKVWLNAASSLRYPVHFTGSQREVELEGEAYFEVSKDKTRPFIVHTSYQEEIKVLGTQFNIMAYANEESRKITLVEGSVQVNSPKGKLVLTPGQQAIVNNSELHLDSHPALDEATGWKKGEFVFDGADIFSIMRQLERWYDVKAVYKTTQSEHYKAAISRDVPVSQLLHYLELTGSIHFRIENKTIYVLP